jgi:hypothetical protein
MFYKFLFLAWAGSTKMSALFDRNCGGPRRPIRRIVVGRGLTALPLLPSQTPAPPLSLLLSLPSLSFLLSLLCYLHSLSTYPPLYFPRKPLLPFNRGPEM